MNTPEQVRPQESGLPIAPPAPRAPGPSFLGKDLGKYHIVRKLGEGGMGTVYEAVHTEIGQRAAIKVLHAQLSHEPKFVKRFIDEARIVSMVGHPGLVKIFDFTQTAQGEQCIIMEFLEGESLWARLSHRLNGEPGLPTRSVLHITRQIASALAQ